MVLNDKQQEALEIARAGHNLLLIGCAGTGKTWTIQTIAEHLMSQGKQVQITCSTGIACSVYSSKFQACTVHRYLGIGDGRFGPSEITSILNNSPNYSHVLEDVNKTDTLIIDECSMISSRTFEIIERVCRLKNQSLLFGGIQVIFAGDFLQLPPVCNIEDSGKYCFESNIFSNTFPHTVTLYDITRTSDHQLVKTIGEIFSGNVSPATEDFISTLSRPLSSSADSVKLFSKNELVDDYNRTSLLKFPGQLHQYHAKDVGRQSDLKKSVTAPKTLWLKVGCPVVLLQNLSRTLVNGLRGKVISLDSEPVVEFESIGVINIPKVKFSVFDRSENKDIASRFQYPLKPAFGLTIHKAQGMTMDRIEVDCRDIFQAGQLGVALSRVTHSSGLRVINYHPRYVIKPPTIVTDFLQGATQDVLEDQTCCKKLSKETHHVMSETEMQPASEPQTDFPAESSDSQQRKDEEEDDWCDEEFDDILAALDLTEEEAVNFNLPQHFNVQNVLQGMKMKEVTVMHKEINETISRIDPAAAEHFIKILFRKFTHLSEKLKVTEKGIPERLLQQFQQQVHTYSVGTEYKIDCFKLFQHEKTFTDCHKTVCFNILEAVKLHFVNEKVELLKDSTGRFMKRQVTDASKPRIRYVAGYCVAKLRHKHATSQYSNMFDSSEKGRNKYEHEKSKVAILDLLKEDESYLKESTTEPDSLADIERKQNITRGLTNVTDGFFHFFVFLTELCLSLLSRQNFARYETDMYKICFTKLVTNVELYEKFVSLLVSRHQDIMLFSDESFHESHSVVFSIVNSIVNRSIIIDDTFNEIVDKYLHVLFGQFCRDIKSASQIEKKMAHRKQIKVSNVKKSDLQPATSASVMPCEPHPGPSSEFSTPSIDESDLCKKCLTDKPDKWIQCDKCNGWFHRKCAGLASAKQWREASKKSAKWFCSECQ